MSAPYRSSGRGFWVAADLAVLLSVVAFLLSACGEHQQIRDLENIPQTQPDKVRLVTNVDQYPNVVALCIDGAGFASTTREGYPALQHVEEWDASNDGWCSAQDDGAAVKQ